MTKEQHEQMVDLEQLRAENGRLFQALTKRNQDYIFTFRKEMEQVEEGDYLKQEHDMLQEMLANQGKGVTATQLYGTPTQYAETLIHGPRQTQKRPANFYELWLDSSLFIGGLFAAMAGVGMMTQARHPGQNLASFGILSLTVNFVLGGLAMAILTYFQQHKAKESKHPMLMYILLGVAVVVAWMAIVFVVTTLIPQVVNPLLPMLAYFIIAVCAFVGRWWYKQKYGVDTGVMF